MPYLCEGGPHTESNIDVGRYCGIPTCGNTVRFNVGALPALPAVESFSVDGASAADTSNPSHHICGWAKQGRHGICLARVNNDRPWQRVVRRKSEDIAAGEIIEGTPVSDHEDPHWYRSLPNIIKFRTTFYYGPIDYTSVGGAPAADALQMPTTLAVPAPDRGTATEPLGLPSEGTWNIDDAFFDGALPHCLTHKPALQYCWDCLRAKRRNVNTVQGHRKEGTEGLRRHADA